MNSFEWILLEIKEYNCVCLKSRQHTEVGTPIPKDLLKSNDTCFQMVTVRIIVTIMCDLYIIFT